MLRRVRAGRPIDDLQAMSDQVARWEEDNPMLGLRGVLGAHAQGPLPDAGPGRHTALTRRIQDGGRPHLEIMIPLVAAAEELIRMREMIEEEIAAATAGSGSVDIPIGTMIELPRAALTAGEIAGVADFFSFGTNDLTQMTYGLSRDDAEGLFLRDYLEQGILSSDPFQTLDQPGWDVWSGSRPRGREANEDLVVGLCGEHGGDPESIYFVHSLGLDYVSCSPPRGRSRLAAAQAALQDDRTDA